jgi:hypothetical protein
MAEELPTGHTYDLALKTVCYKSTARGAPGTSSYTHLGRALSKIMSFEVGSRFLAGGPSTRRSEAGSPVKGPHVAISKG